MIKNLVSVVITTKNEEKNIERCLKSIKNQTYPGKKIEIIVVDNNSIDKTVEIANLYTKLVFNKGPERSAQRNYGIEKASGKYILFLDADMSLSEGVIEECVKKFTSMQVKELIGLYIPEKILGNSFWCHVRDFERSFYNATVVDCVRFFPKNIWKEVGRFDEDLTGPEDWDFDNKMRIRGNVDIIKSPLYHNESDFTFNNYLKRKSYYTKSLNKYIRKWGKDNPNIRKQLGFWYRYIAVFTEQRKWEKIFSHPFLALGMFLLRFLVGVRYLKIINEKTMY